MSRSGQRLYEKAKVLIPGGTQLLTKRPERFAPEQWPSYFSRAKGVDVWDLDGNQYLDMSYNSVGASVLGVADPDVDAAVKKAIDVGTISTLNCPEEVELAELLIELHPWADMVRYARCGGEAVAIAVRIARAHTRKDTVAFCGYHGWHDWYLAANLGENDALDGHLRKGLEPLGVPRALRGTVFPFHYNAIDELKAIVRNHGSDLAAIVMEPIRSTQPQEGFLQEVRQLADETGAVLVFDEVSAGFRLCCGGAHLLFGVEPDIAVFAKGMSNGYPMAAVIGRGSVMDIAWKTFISSTHWTERIGLVAALATIRKYRKHRVHEHLIAMGESVQQCWRDCAQSAGLSLKVGGIAPLSHFSFESDEPQAVGTLFTQLMLDHRILACPAFYATYAHTSDHVAAYHRAVEDVFVQLSDAIRTGTVQERLNGPVAFADFRRFA